MINNGEKNVVAKPNLNKRKEGVKTYTRGVEIAI
jgi:hypothetical protein